MPTETAPLAPFWQVYPPLDVTFLHCTTTYPLSLFKVSFDRPRLLCLLELRLLLRLLQVLLLSLCLLRLRLLLLRRLLDGLLEGVRRVLRRRRVRVRRLQRRWLLLRQPPAKAGQTPQAPQALHRAGMSDAASSARRESSRRLDLLRLSHHSIAQHYTVRFRS